MKRSPGILLAGIIALAVAATDVGATPVTFAATDGTHSASVTFAAVENNLYVTLANTASVDSLRPTDVLTAVLFDFNATLTPVSATAAPGSSVQQLNSNGTVTAIPVTDVSGEWAYKAGLSGTPGGATKGISSSGLGLFGPADLFNPKGNLAGPVTPDGLQYGITSAGDNPATGNGDFIGTPLLRNAVTFVLSGGVPDIIDLHSISHVEFIFGTSLETHFEPPADTVPEPSTIILSMLGLTAFIISRKLLPVTSRG